MKALLLSIAALAGLPAAATECRQETVDGHDYSICEVDLTRERLALFLYDETGEPYGHFSTLERALEDKGLTLGFAMNAGMYHDDRAPVGHLRIDGEDKMRVITSAGPGNFGLLPNGVFWLDGKTVGVTETKAFKKAKRKVHFATQSGPMLVIDGKLHPRFLPKSNSRKVRNGIGVSADGAEVHFAISQRRVTFWEFGQLFREKLRTPNALFLDGSVSGFRSPRMRQESWRALGPMISVLPR